MTKPAARKGDKHDCPKKSPTPHVGGPILEGSSNVTVNGKPAARVGDKLKCQNGSSDTITSGSSTVTINGKPAARVGDKTDHGGKITAGSDNVFIGSGGRCKISIGNNCGKVSIGNFGKVFLGVESGSETGKEPTGQQSQTTEILGDIGNVAFGVAAEIAGVPEDEIGVGEVIQAYGAKKIREGVEDLARMASEDEVVSQAEPRPEGLEEGAIHESTVDFLEPYETDEPLVHPAGTKYNLEEDLAATFHDKPEPVVLPEGTEIYRVISRQGKSNGSFWTGSFPSSKAEWRSSFAVPSRWNEDGYYVKYVVPKGGLPAWIGKTASQRIEIGSAWLDQGGAEQIVIPSSFRDIPKNLKKIPTTQWEH